MQRRSIDPWTWQEAFGFSHAVEVVDARAIVFCAGQVSVDEEGRPLHAGDLLAQFHCALDNLERVLGQAGLTLADLTRLNYYVTDVDAFHAAVPELGKRLQAARCKPASTLLGVSRLAMPELMIEIEGTAAAPSAPAERSA
jgi:enamine deaminase RidA (YjgF/YER057c/UK114 family)